MLIRTPPETSVLLDAPAYRRSIDDQSFLQRDELRGTRFALEYQKVDLAMRDMRVESTVTIFGSARILSAENARSNLLAIENQEVQDLRGLAVVKKQLQMSHWYTVAQKFAHIVAEKGGSKQNASKIRNLVLTGGGPGIMEAGNRGAWNAGAPTAGLSIELEFENAPNRFVTPEMAFRCHYFHVRKFMMVMRASGIAVFPGGYGTLDELGEVLTLIQTAKGQRCPVVLFGRDWWDKAVGFEFLASEGLIERADLDIIRWAETADEGWDHMISGGLQAA